MRSGRVLRLRARNRHQIQFREDLLGILVLYSVPLHGCPTFILKEFVIDCSAHHEMAAALVLSHVGDRHGDEACAPTRRHLAAMCFRVPLSEGLLPLV